MHVLNEFYFTKLHFLILLNALGGIPDPHRSATGQNA